MGTSGINGFRADRLAEIRRKIGLSQAEAAERMHLSVSGYSNFERGLRMPSWQTILTMSLALGTSVGYFTGETDNPAPTHILTAIEDNDELAGLISCFRRLSAEEQDAVAVIIKAMAKDQHED